ncbi:MAG TPA: HNH endonuclease signature motif containing protein [Actinomycetota bacterium]|nr:HNH endonuclease signature motif containing protein [Actinomycetota bacterium]
MADRASKRGRKGRTSPQAALADALVELARNASAGSEDPLRPKPRTSLHVRVDHSALTRGHTVAGEICEVPGVGPVPVSTVNEWMKTRDPVVTALLVDGEDIRKVVKVGRSIPGKLEAALVERDQCCVVPGCGEIYDLETDHVVEVARGGPTTLYNLARLCAWHHYLKTHHGYVLKRRLGHWLFEDPGGVPPDLDGLQQELAAVGYTGTVAGPRSDAGRWAPPRRRAPLRQRAGIDPRRLRGAVRNNSAAAPSERETDRT